MKLKTILLFVFIALVATGCLVKSLHPFYKDSDVIFEPALIGTWLDKDSSIWTIEQKKVSFMGPERFLNSYKITFSEKENETSVLDAHLFKLNGQLYVDFIPSDVKLPDLTSFHLVPAHSIAKVAFSSDSISLKWFNETWLAGLFENNKIRISHETIRDENDADTYVLTASTEELQKFIIKYGNDPLAFKDNSDKNKPVKERDDLLCFTLRRVK
jgi:hypothetical protein